MRYAWFVVALLALVNSLNAMDRWAMSVLIEPIKRDLLLSDTQLGLLTGLAFALGYSLFALPIGRLADVGNRRNVLIGCLSLWSLMTGLLGLSQYFWQMLLARIGVGVGEAGCNPTGQSIISDYFPAEKRPFALSLFASGLMIGKIFGIGGAGLLVVWVGWRHTLLILAVPGFVVALLVRLFIKEPAKGRFEALERNASPLPFWPTFRQLVATRSYLRICIALAFANFVIFGVQSWSPAFYMRTHGLTAAQVGAAVALVVGVGGVVGLLAGGYFSQRMMERDPRWPPLSAAVCHVAAGICSIVSFTVPDPHVALMLFALSSIILSLPTGGVFATQLNAVDARTRATASAFSMLLTSLIGLGMGPLIVGAISDAMTSRLGPEGLGYALIIVSCLNVLPAFFYCWAARALPMDIVKRADESRSQGAC